MLVNRFLCACAIFISGEVFSIFKWFFMHFSSRFSLAVAARKLMRMLVVERTLSRAVKILKRTSSSADFLPFYLLFCTLIQTFAKVFAATNFSSDKLSQFSVVLWCVLRKRQHQNFSSSRYASLRLSGCDVLKRVT
jgi:hypothetical protein